MGVDNKNIKSILTIKRSCTCLYMEEKPCVCLKYITTKRKDVTKAKNPYLNIQEPPGIRDYTLRWRIS